MAERADSWMRRRGIPASEREWCSPWQRLHEHLAQRYAIHVALSRRWERPDADDRTNLPLLLRQASAAIDADVARAGRALSPPLSPVECDVLRRVRSKPSAGANLSEYLRVSPQRVSQIVRRLEDRGLLRKEESARDARVRALSVTDRGAELARVLDVHLRELADLWLEEADDEGEDAKDCVLRLVAVLADLT